MNKYNDLSRYKVEKIMKCFCVDIEATKIVKLLGFNRKPINKYYLIFRQDQGL